MKRKRRLPDFRKMTDDQMGEWIKTHDLTDYLDQLEIVDDPADMDREVILPIRLKSSIVRSLKRLAQKTGARGASTYARIIITKAVNDPEAQAA